MTDAKRTMTKDELAQVEAAARAAGNEAVLLLVAEIRDLHAALSALPEDVARDVDDLVLFISATGATRCQKGCACRPHSALSRLATAAARVPEMVAERAQLLEQVGAATREAASCMAERNRVTAELEAEQAGRLEFRKRFGALTSETFGAFVERLASERDAARQETAQERVRVTAISDRLEDALTERDHARDEADALRSKVATLEAKAAQVAAQRKVAQELARARLDLLKRTATALACNLDEVDTSAAGLWADLDDAKVRAEASERRVAELERERAVDVEMLSERGRTIATITARVAELERQAQEVVESLPVTKAAIAFAGHLPSYIRTVIEAHRRELADAYESTSDTHLLRIEQAEAKVKALEERVRELHGDFILSGPDAHPTSAPGLREAVGELLEAWDEAEQAPWSCETEAKEWVAVQMETLRDRAAAYDATPESVTHARLAAVVEEYAKEQEAKSEEHAAKSKEEDDAEAISADYCLGRAEGAREVLRRVTGGQVPDVLPKARVVEVLSDARNRHLKSAQECAGSSLEMDHRAMADACTQVATRLNLTLPTGPGGGDASPNTPETTATARAALGLEPTPRARIAPTPTPEANDSGCGCGSFGHEDACPASEFSFRARTGPTPTPEVPTLAQRFPEWAATDLGREVTSTPTGSTPEHVEPVTLGKGPFTMVPEVAARAVERTAALVREAQAVPVLAGTSTACCTGHAGSLRQDVACEGPPVLAGATSAESLERECSEVVEREGFGGAVAWAQQPEPAASMKWSDLSSTPRPAPHAGCRPDECDDGLPEQCPAFGKPDTEPEPAAPEVAWEVPGSVRVVGPLGEEHAEVKSRDGEWYEANVGNWAYVLARALAEAKRETVALEAVARSARKAAEDMRERATRALADHRNSLHPDKHCERRRGVQQAIDIVRALPLGDV